MRVKSSSSLWLNMHKHTADESDRNESIHTVYIDITPIKCQQYNRTHIRTRIRKHSAALHSQHTA